MKPSWVSHGKQKLQSRGRARGRKFPKREQLQSVRTLGVEGIAGSSICLRMWVEMGGEKGRGQIKDPCIHSDCLGLLHAGCWFLKRVDQSPPAAHPHAGALTHCVLYNHCHSDLYLHLDQVSPVKCPPTSLQLLFPRSIRTCYQTSDM